MTKKAKQDEGLLMEELDSLEIDKNEETTDSGKKAGKRKKKKKNGWKFALAGLVLLVAGVYGGGTYYYSSHFPHNTYANGLMIGDKTVDEAEKVFTEDYDAHSIVVKEKERKEIINARDINTVISVDNQVQNLFDAMNPWLWFTEVLGQNDNTLHLDVSYDKEALKSVIDQMEGFQKDNIVAPEDAYITAGEKEFEIVPEVPGNTILKDEFIAAIENCLATGLKTIDLVESDLYLQPKYFSTDEVVTEALEKANKYTKGTIIHDFQYTTETLDYNTTKKWIKISKDFKKVKLSKSKVGDYVESLGKKYNTMGSARPFTTAYGKKRNIYDGDYGWKIYFDKEKEQLIKDIKSGEDITREPIYSYTAAIRTEETDIPNSYVEVSIDRQELWLIIDGKCVLNTSVVTGKPPHGTTKGIYGLTYKKRDDVLEGFNSDGTSYASHVDYWMPFNGNQGLHDASWRNSFGGSIYKTNGSHGCVNLPPYAAATIYKYVDTNFPVIIY